MFLSGRTAGRTPSGPGVQFDAKDYWAPTPDWALYGSEEARPNPRNRRLRSTSGVLA